MIELQAVTKTYVTKRLQVTALSDVSLWIGEGEIVGVIGKSGSGKSTLARCMNLLERPSAGSVVVDGQVLMAVTTQQLRDVRRKIGMVFQHFNLLHSRTVYQNVALPLQLLGNKREAIRKTVLPLLALVGLEDKQNVYPSQLSGGQKQRVAIARALAPKPKILLCDEMTSALDPESSESILKLIKQVREQFALTVIVITHAMNVIKRLVDRVIVLDQGHLIHDSTVVDLFKSSEPVVAKQWVHASCQFDVPDELLAHCQVDFVVSAYALWRIHFIGQTAQQPIVNALIKQFAMEVNILRGNIEHMGNTMMGALLLAVRAKDVELQNGLRYLKAQGLTIEELGYVRSDDWFYS